MRVDFDYVSMPVHKDFHRSSAYERELFGAFGSGKTYAIIAEAIAWCLEQPGIRGLITRKTVPELSISVTPPSPSSRSCCRPSCGAPARPPAPAGTSSASRSPTEVLCCSARSTTGTSTAR